MAASSPDDAPVGNQTVVAKIRASILDGRLQPGQRLTEDQLASTLGVSRTPVREALRILQAEGLVDSAPFSGARVRAYGSNEIDVAFQARALLEGLATRRAASRITHEQIELLEASNARYETFGPLTETNVRAVIEENDAFHGTILAAANSALIAETVAKLSELPIVHKIRVGLVAGEHKRIAEHTHRRIVQALVAGDEDWAEALARAHVLELREHTLAHLARVAAEVDEQEIA